MKFIKTFLAVIFTEWKLFFRDPAALLLVVVAVAVYAVYYPLPYLNQTVSKVPVAIVDLDGSAMSRNLIRMSLSTQSLDVVAVYDNMDSAELAMAETRVYGIMRIPENMERRVQHGENVAVGIYTHGSYVMLHGAIGTAFATCVATLNAPIKVKRLVLSRGLSLAEAKSIRDPFPVQFRTMFNGVSGYANYVVPAVLVLILQQTIIVGACTLGGPRRNRKFRGGHFESENSPAYMRFLGRGFAFFTHYCIWIAVFHYFIYALFEFPRRGDFVTIAAFAASFLPASIAFAFVCSLAFKHRESAMQFFLFLSIPFLFLSGFSWPRASMPEWMQWFGCLVPSTYAVPAWLATEQLGASLQEISHYLYALLCQACGYGILGYILLKIRDRHPGKGEI